VYEHVHPPETPEDDYESHHTSGYTEILRSAFQVALARAGYVVVLGRHEECDLVARISGTWVELHAAAVATLKLSAGERVVEQLSVAVPQGLSKDFDYHLDEGAALLVEKMSASPNVAAFAREVAGRTPKVAAPR